MIIIYKTGYFESAHLLKGHPKCGKNHGHSFKYEIWIADKNVKGKWGFILDFAEIKKYFNQFDHSDKTIMISSEEMVINANSYFKKLCPDAKIKVRIWETVNSYAETE